MKNYLDGLCLLCLYHCTAATFARRLLFGATPTEIEAAQAKANAEAVKRFGMHYQWGRKDPFTPATNTGYIAHNNAKEVQIYNANGNTITKGAYGIGATDEHEFKYEERTTTTQTTINNLIQNPSTHYHKGDGTNNVPIASTEYYKDTKEGDWWNPTIKTIYDPCPNGYRIPKSGTYGYVANTTNPSLIGWDWSSGGLTSGYTWNNTFFPASGRRTSNSGQFSVVGTGGNRWVSTPYLSTLGHNLHFHSSAVHPNNNYYRPESNLVRCIKE